MVSARYWINDKLSDFVEEYWHFDNITNMTEKQFIESYSKWAKKKGYRPSEAKAIKIYALAKEGIPTLPSNTPSTKMLVLEAVRVLREVDKTLLLISITNARIGNYTKGISSRPRNGESWG